MHHANLEKLKSLRLFGMVRALQELTGMDDRGRLDFDDQLALLIERETADRTNAALEMRLKRARLRQAACVENLDLKASRGLDKGLIRDLFTCRWICQHRHVILTGATGTGKTWIACALGNQAAREGFSVLYTRLSRLLDDIATARLGSGAGALMRRLARVDLLILDDGMMSELTATQRRDLMEIVDDRHDRGSIILASQIPLSSWHRAIGDSTYSEAILDRIVHAAYRVELQGDSLRKPARNGIAPSGSAIDQPASNLEKTTVK
jgi:DNA replication protein DnaC